MPRLIVMSGLPGTGKTTLSRPLARALRAVYVRVDTIEQAIRSSTIAPVEVVDHGYRAAYGVAADNLALGLDVVAESVNPIEETRAGWRQVAMDAGAECHAIELLCGDQADHRHRVETRKCDIAGLIQPTWAQVAERHYVPWTSPHMVVDTSALTPEAAVEAILQGLGQG